MHSFILNRFCALAAVVFVIAGAARPASATTHTWPILECSGTLQACIDASNPGDTVLIGSDEFFLPDGYTRIDEDISINKSLTLEAAYGIDAVFAPERSIVVNSPGSGATSVTLRRLVLQHGHVVFDHFSDSASSYFADGLRVIETDAVSNCAIQFFDFGSGSPQFTVGNSTVELNHSGPGACALFAQGNGGPWQGAFSGNHIRAENGSASGSALIHVLGTSSGTFRIASNQIVGRGFAGGIDVWQLPGSGANTWYIDDNYIDGEVVTPTSGFAGIFVTPQNSELHVVNNTISHGTQGLFIHGPSSLPDSSSGQIANNLVAFHSGAGLAIATIAGLGNRNNLVYANASNGFVPGPGTLTADPLFLGPRNPRLYSTSPAQDTGSDADVPAFTLDADGERRINGTVDIGAFEYSGDYSIVHVASAGDACCNDSPILETFPEPLGSLEKMLVTSQHGSGDATQLVQNIGVYLVDTTPQWAVFHENTSIAMQPGQPFNVFAPYHGYSAFVHTTTVASVFGRYSKLPTLDGGAGAIAFVTHNWNPAGSSGVYHDQRVGLERFGSDWYIRNEDSSVDMPVGVSFNVVVAPLLASANAWQQLMPFTSGRLQLSHPRLDDNPCAAPQVTRVDDPLNPTVINDDVPFGVQYVGGAGAGAPGHWTIVAEGAGTPTFPLAAGFNIMVPGAQADACRDGDRIFADGFDA
ncbi:MAG: choice-of-anchor Q domain-containing protein [Dokdonella sp.]